jgi:hypothetical protein
MAASKPMPIMAGATRGEIFRSALNGPWLGASIS